VTKDVLLHLVSSVVLLEPVEQLISVAVTDSDSWKGIKSQQKSVSFIKRPLQQFDPSIPLSEEELFAHVGAPVDLTEGDQGYDVIWCQWCLGHLSDKQLVRFFKMAQNSLRENGIIVVKENCCPPAKQGESDTIYDSDDSSLTR
jgi:protein N-terminal methyltransferase